MKRSILFLILINIFSSLAAQYSVSGGSGFPLLAENNTQYNLQVYLLNGLSNARISFTSSNGGNHQWYRYRENGNNAVPVTSVQNGNTSYITDVEDGYGYFVGLHTDPLTSFVWIIDYSRYVPRFFGMITDVVEDDKCEYLTILTDYEAEPLIYFLPTGQPRNLNRVYHLQYETQVWNEDNLQFEIQEKNESYINEQIYERFIPAPLCDTYFTLTGDDFAEHFGLQQTIRSELYKAIAVEAHATAITTKEHADNEIHNTGESLGGSSPIEYTFTAYANEPVAMFYYWTVLQQDSVTNEMSIIFRNTEKVLSYNFERDGAYRVELEVVNGSLGCVDATQFFKVIIESTVIKIPNAFSPGSSIGVNDELRVSFSSIISFKASVYNRQGNLLFQWNDPAKGWDGRVNGRFVPTGVHYVIVEYKDSSGKAKSMSKAVNVLRAKN